MYISYDNHRVVIFIMTRDVQKLLDFDERCPEKILLGKKGEY